MAGWAIFPAAFIISAGSQNTNFLSGVIGYNHLRKQRKADIENE